MTPAPFIVLAAGDGPGLDVIIWLVAGAFWVIAQIAAAKKRQQRKKNQDSPGAPRAGPRTDAGDSPDAEELAEIFERLGADIPSTPPPQASRVQQPPPAPPRKRVDYNKVRPIKPAPVRSDIAERLARVKREAAEAAHQAAQALRPRQPYIENSQDPPVEACSLATTDQSTGTILPRLYAMDLRMSPFPSIPMPSANRSHHTCEPLPIQLRTPRDLRNAIVAQTFLSPAKSTSL